MSISKVTIESLSRWLVTFFTLINYLESSFNPHLENEYFIELRVSVKAMGLRKRSQLYVATTKVITNA